MVSHPGYGAVPPDNSGTGTVIISSPDATATYTASSVTVTPKHANVTLGSGNGLTYTSGTGVTTGAWAPTGAYASTGKMKLIGEDADIDINGKSLKDTLQALEHRLNILVPNPELEQEWSELQQLGDKYRKLEADLEEKARMWRALNKVAK